MERGIGGEVKEAGQRAILELTPVVTPAKAGVQCIWIPAFAGMTCVSL